MSFVSDYILPNGGQHEHTDEETIAAFAAYEREHGTLPSSREGWHWEGNRIVKSPLL